MPPRATVPTTHTGDFLNWWFQKRRLDGEPAQTFRAYYANYYRRLDGYLKTAWNDRHLELDRAIDRISKLPNPRFLDIGCGTGSIALYTALKLGSHGSVDGVDIKTDRLRCASERKKVLERELGTSLDCRFINSNVLSLPNTPGYDLIYMEETFHHLEPRARIVEKTSHLLKKNGVLIISEVNAFNPLMMLHLIKTRGFRTIKRMVTEDGASIPYGNERVLPAGSLAIHFKDHGLSITSLRYFRLFSSGFAHYAEKHIPLAKVERCLLMVYPFNRLFSVHYNLVFQRAG